MNRAPLEKVWATIPDVACKGLCVECCGPVSGSPMEVAILAEHGVHLAPPVDTLLSIIAGRTAGDCPALVDGRCSVYDDRPTVCRLWGAVEGMPCEYGCEPAGGLLPDRAGRRILIRAEQAGQLSNRRTRRR